MKQLFKRVSSVLLVVMMLMNLMFTSAFAAEIVTGVNGKTVYLSIGFANSFENFEEISSVNAGDVFYAWIGFANNPTTSEDSGIRHGICSYDMFIGYDSDKVSIDPDYGLIEDMTTNIAFNPAYDEEDIVFAGWASDKSIADRRGNVYASGNMFTLEFEAKTDLTMDDLAEIAFIDGASGAKFAVSDGNEAAFTVVQLPALVSVSVDENAKIYTSSGEVDIIDAIESVTYIDATGTSTTYTSADDQWADLLIELPQGGLVVGKNTLTAYFNGYTCDFEIDVKEDALVRLDINTTLVKTDYVAYDTFDKDGLKVTAVYESDATKVLAENEYTVDTATQLKVADTKWAVTYGGKTAYIDITVEPKKIDKPVVEVATYTYTGETIEFAYSDVDAEYVSVEGNLSGKDVKTYGATAKLIKEDTEWTEGGTDDVTLSWTIVKTQITEGIADFAKKYTTLYSELDTQAELTGVNDEEVLANIAWYTDDTYASQASGDLAAAAEVGRTITLYYKATGMANYEDYEGTVRVNILDKDAAEIEWTALPDGLSGDGNNKEGIYSKDGYTITKEMFTVKHDGDTLGTPNVTISNATGVVDKITDVGTYTVVVAYEDKDHKAEATYTVEIEQKSIAGASVSLEFEQATYTAEAIAPQVISVEGLNAGDYDVAVEAKTNAGEYTITVTGKGNYTGTATATWKIVPAEITLASATIADKAYNGETEDAEVTAVAFAGLLGTDTLTLADCDVVSAEYASANAANEVAVSVTVALKNTVSNYVLKTATVGATGKIEKAAAPSVTATGVQTLLSSAIVDGAKDYQFNLENILSGVKADAGTVTYAVKTEGDYTTSTIEGKLLKVLVETAQAAGEDDAVVITVSSTNYADVDVTVNFEFKNKIDVTSELTLADIETTYLDAYEVKGAYAGHDYDAALWSYVYEGMDCLGGLYSSTEKPVKAGEYTVTATYEDEIAEGEIPGHIGTVTATIEIAQKEITEADFAIDLEDKQYNGSAIEPSIVSDLVKGTDYEVEYQNNVNAGTARIVVAGIGSCTGEFEKEFTIKAKAIAEADFTFDLAEKVFTGLVIEPAVTSDLVKDTDYTVSYGRNINASVIAGPAIITVTGIGNYTGKIEKEFIVLPRPLDEAELEISGYEATYTYTCEAIAPTLSIKWNNMLLIEDVEYTVAYANNTNAGTASITITGIGNHTGEIEKTFTITPKAIAEADFIFDLEGKVYTGAEIKPAVTSELNVETDYDVVYANNTNAGTASITVTGTDNYTGTFTKDFTIAPKALDDTFTISGYATEYTYTSEAIVPTMIVNWSGNELEKDTDYTVAYADNVNVGAATVTITGIGNYADALTANFNIKAAAYIGTVTIAASAEPTAVDTVLTANAPAGDSLTYQWYRNGAVIEGAVAADYTVVEEDIDKALSVKVTSTGNVAGELTSAAITIGKTVLSATVTLAEAEGVITATVTGAPAEENYKLVWLRNGMEIAGAAGTTYTISDKDKGTEISAKIIAVGDVYTGEVSGNAIAVPAEAPSNVNITATAGNASITVLYSAKANGAAILNYEIIVDGTVVATVAGNVTSYTITGLTNDKTYAVEVAAINAVGRTVSEVKTATPSAPIVTGGGAGSSSNSSAVTTTSTTGGKVVSNISKARPGSKVTVEVDCEEGYKLSKLIIKDKKGKEIEVTIQGDMATFIMPSSAVSIEAEFEKVEEPEKPDEPIVEPETGKFNDVQKTAYYYDAVNWAVEKGITSGTSENSFSPENECSRAQMITFLWRAAGSPKATKANPFADVSTDAYYYDAVLWALENNITSGISAESFAPDATVSRSQTVTFLWRLAGQPSSDKASAFADVAQDAYYNGAVAWAADANVTYGVSDTLFGSDDACARAQIVTFIYRYFVK